jgi:type VI secretion system protein ImpC
MQIPRIPFKILALAPYLPYDQNIRLNKPLSVDNLNLDQVIDELKPTFTVAIPGDLYPAENLEIKIREMKDFHPDGIMQNNPALGNIRKAVTYLEDAKKKGRSRAEITARLKKWQNLPPIQIETETKKPASSSGDPVDSILSMVDLPDSPSGIPSQPRDAGSQLNLQLSDILRNIFSNPTFRALESAWRGLKLLLQEVNRHDGPRVEIFPMYSDSLEETLDRLTPELIEATPSLILIDLPFDSSPRSLDLMARIAQFSETLLVPTIVWITPGFFHLDSWQGLKKLEYLPHFLAEPPYGKWQSLKKKSAANWLAATCNRFVVRYPYGNDNQPRLVQFEEQRPLWASPVWALGCLIAQSFSRTGWPTRFTEWQKIRLEDLPLNTEDPDHPLPLETHLNRERIDQFIRSGIIPLATMSDKDIAFVPAAPAVGRAALSYQLFVSRITRLIIWCRDHLQKDLAGVELEAALQRTFTLFWEASGHVKPENFSVETGETQTNGRIPLRIQLEPSPQILSPAEKVELEFFW